MADGLLQDGYTITVFLIFVWILRVLASWSVVGKRWGLLGKRLCEWGVRGGWGSWGK